MTAETPTIEKPAEKPPKEGTVWRMKAMTSAEFKKIIDGDGNKPGEPAWAADLTETVVITDYCDLQNSSITHLSPFLVFQGRDKNGNCASFRGCTELKTGEGTFHGFVDFGPTTTFKNEVKLIPCGIERLNVHVVAPNLEGAALSIAYTTNPVPQRNLPRIRRLFRLLHPRRRPDNYKTKPRRHSRKV